MLFASFVQSLKFEHNHRRETLPYALVEFETCFCSETGSNLTPPTGKDQVKSISKGIEDEPNA